MKILHLADLHLGKSINNIPLVEDQKDALKQALNLCVKENIKHIIISGDVYDRSVPKEEAVTLLNDFLSEVILDNKIKVYIIPGNHDSNERLSCFDSLLEKAGLFIDGDFNNDLSFKKHSIEEDGLKVNIYSFPYVYPSDIRLKSGDNNIKEFDEMAKFLIQNTPLNKEEINILNTHYFVTETGVELIRCDSEVKSSIGTIDQISSSLFNDYDYVALGHLHCPQNVGRNTVRYGGSPLKYSESEINQEKYFTIINIKSKNDISIEKGTIKPLREFKKYKGKLEELLINPEIKDTSIAFFELTDETYVVDAASKLKIKFPNYEGMKYINILNADTNVTNKNIDDLDKMSPKEQTDLFYKEIIGRELNKEETLILDEVLASYDKESK